ncbi:suppressor of IKBKE 1 [Pitangus sulphuratus]|nr:suppressor of IKBKE 1 [Pitangus sulphuratus]
MGAGGSVLGGSGTRDSGVVMTVQGGGIQGAGGLEIESQIDRICEMGEVMRKAVQVDDDQFFKVQEKLAQLELENKELRELLSISKESFEVEREDLPDCEA